MIVTLTIISVAFEFAFIPWYLMMMGIMGHSIRSFRRVDHISVGMFVFLTIGLLNCGWMIWHLTTVPMPVQQLAGGLVLDTARTVTATYFIWYLRLKELLTQWLSLKESE